MIANLEAPLSKRDEYNEQMEAEAKQAFSTHIIKSRSADGSSADPWSSRKAVGGEDRWLMMRNGGGSQSWVEVMAITGGGLLVHGD